MHLSRNCLALRGLPALGLAALLGAGCAMPSASSEFTQRQPRPAAIRETIHPLFTPRQYKADFVFPERITHQALSWDHQGCEWRIQIPTIEKATAGVVFRRTYDMSETRERTYLAFKLRPAALDHRLTVAIIDEAEQIHGIRHLRPLSEFKARDGGDWGHYTICLDEFEENWGNMSRRPALGPPGVLDWSSVRGVIVTRLPGQAPPFSIIIRNLSFQIASASAPHPRG
jgi:hypothetical protein